MYTRQPEVKKIIFKIDLQKDEKSKITCCSVLLRNIHTALLMTVSFSQTLVIQAIEAS